MPHRGAPHKGAPHRGVGASNSEVTEVRFKFGSHGVTAGLGQFAGFSWPKAQAPALNAALAVWVGDTWRKVRQPGIRELGIDSMPAKESDQRCCKHAAIPMFVVRFVTYPLQFRTIHRLGTVNTGRLPVQLLLNASSKHPRSHTMRGLSKGAGKPINYAALLPPPRSAVLSKQANAKPIRENASQGKTNWK